MAEHYTRNTISVTKFCPTCNRKTRHRVDDRRLGVCMEQHVKGDSKPCKKKKEDDTGDLFE